MPPPKRGHFVLHSSILPPVTAGSYELVSDQIELPFDVQEEHTHVKVSSPRFTMPPDQILSTFPPANGEGAFGDKLPQIVLKRRTLPWERNPAEQVAVSTIPWLALVVVAEGEAQLSTPTPVEQCITPGHSVPLLEPTDRDVAEGLYLAVTQTVLNKIFPTKDDVPLLVHVREVDVQDTELAAGDDDGWSAVVIANRLPVYDTANDKPVRYLVCLVSLECQLEQLPKPSNAVDTFTFTLAQDWSILGVEASGNADHFVTGVGAPASPLTKVNPNAPALAAGAAEAHSLPAIGAGLGAAAGAASHSSTAWTLGPTEAVASAAFDADAARVVRDTMGIGFRYPIERFAQEKTYRFPVLAHWSFTTSEGATFETLMQDLDDGLLGSLPVPEPGAPPKPAVTNLVETGHIELDHQTRRGDAAHAWYRGPFVPHPTDRDVRVDNRLPVAHSADQLRRIVPDGREDLAYAAAYEIGRLLALSQLSIVSALLRFRREQFGAGRVKYLLEKIVPKELRPPLDDFYDLSRLVSTGLVDNVAASPLKVVGPARPIADPGRPLKISGSLDTVVAEGLGLDLTELRANAETVGMVAALAATDVPLVQLGEGPLVEGPQLEAMGGALRAEVARLAALAVQTPLKQAAATEARGAAPPEPSRDPLDELLDRVPDLEEND
ncbi:MAG: hypothetical protein ACJ76U_13365 [Gaiellaceae bacterium]